jgi:hypothetical protein
MWWGTGSLGFGSEGDYSEEKSSWCTHHWEEEYLFHFTYFKCTYCGQTKQFEEIRDSDKITKRITNLPLRKD